MKKILIKNGKVWDGERFFDADVLIEEGKVSKLQKDIDARCDVFFDARGMIVSAGLVDMHMHIRGVSEHIYGCSGDLFTMPFGVTSAGDGGAVNGDGKILNGGLLKAVAFVPIDIKNNQPDFSFLEEKCDKFKDCLAGYKVYFDNNGGQVTDVSPLASIMERAQKDGKIVMVHCNGSPVSMSEYLPYFRAGDILTHAFHGGNFTAEEDDFQALVSAQKRGVIIDGGFAGNVHLGFGVFSRAIEKGVIPNVISTDVVKGSGYTRGGRYGMTECMSIARALGMKEEDIFRAVTSSAGACIGKGGEWGVLKEGGIADIAVLDFTRQPFNLTDRDGFKLSYEKGYRCKLTVANGEIAYVD